MNKLSRTIFSLGLAILNILIGGGLVVMIAHFAQIPVTYRMACGVSLLISLIELQRIKWAEEDARTAGQRVEDAIRGVLAYGLFALFILGIGWGFHLAGI